VPRRGRDGQRKVGDRLDEARLAFADDCKASWRMRNLSRLETLFPFE